MARSRKILETDLYEPVREYLVRHGYEVMSEVVNCDIAATRNDELIVVELKRSANMQLLIQATDRQRITDAVYVAIPNARHLASHWRGVQRILRMLELGLLLVDFDFDPPHVTRQFDPMPYARRKRSDRRRAVIRELEERSGDYNTGGSSGVKLATAYRENAILIACCLERLGPATPKQLRELGCGTRTQSILANNYYGWFQRVERGVYELTAAGRAEMGDYPVLVERFRSNLTLPGEES